MKASLTLLVLTLLVLAACGDAASMPGDGGVEDGALPKSQRCVSCHMQDYLDADHPVHVGKKPTTCIVCHTQTSWHPHVTHHDWPLTGAHARGHCAYCHDQRPPVYEGLHDECVDCHREDYDRAGFAGHDRFPLTCDECHDTRDWGTATLTWQQPQYVDEHWDAGVDISDVDLGVEEPGADVDAGARRRRRRDAGTGGGGTWTPPDVITSPSRR